MALSQVCHLSSPSDGLSTFPQDHTCKWCQGTAENSVPVHEYDLLNKTIHRICNKIRNTTGATCGAGLVQIITPVNIKY